MASWPCNYFNTHCTRSTLLIFICPTHCLSGNYILWAAWKTKNLLCSYFSFPVLHNYFSILTSGGILMAPICCPPNVHTCSGSVLTHTSVCQLLKEKECKQESREQRRWWTVERGGILILLWGIVAHKVNSVLPYFSPYVHCWTHVHSTAHSVSGCPDQL